MNYFQDITLLPDAEIGSYFLWHKVFQRIHLALAKNKKTNNQSLIGIDFPGYAADKNSLGAKLRLIAENAEPLKQMRCEKWLTPFKDYVHIRSIKPVPENISGYACFKNIKPKSNKEKLARRRAKRKGESFREALAHYDDFLEQRSKLPYINMISQTNGHRFRLFIEKQEMREPQAGLFSCYGLSNRTTVPLF
jgi:CRISPR-associated endonuclease Csy4